MNNKLANCHPKLSRGRVWCTQCGMSMPVNSGYALSNGWPMCCGYTMTIDSPEERAKMTAQQSLAEIEAAAVENCLPPVMTDTTVPVACRSPHDFMIGFNRCRNEIKRNAENQLRQQGGE